MKALIFFIRIITGALFIFSGLVKAIDPLGLAYKMEEFFEAFASEGWMPGLMNKLNHYALSFSIAMITLEVVLGVALLIGFRKKITSILLLLLMILFTFLTSYVLFSGKIRACGCFGDCIPLTPMQTFSKDIILLIFTILLLIYQKYIHPIHKPLVIGGAVILTILGTLFLQWYVLKHLPLADCLPFKKGNNIIELRKMPPNAIQDKFDYVFVYSKDGQSKDFKADSLPDDSWEFVDRVQKLIQKGSNNIPIINDFHLTDADGNDVTEKIMVSKNGYYMLYLRDIPSGSPKWVNEFKKWKKEAKQPVYLVVTRYDEAVKFGAANNLTFSGVLTLDATALKTACRAAATLYKMEGPIIKEKWSWADIGKATY
ncbi:MAG: DoxX family protein [Ferruginibacter sp.]|nr:DoxX family protein [Ferruginibacter sp.]